MHKMEKRFAEILDKKNIRWVYLPGIKFFNLKNSRYTPDFYLPKQKTYIEVVGSLAAYYANRKKYKEFKTMYPRLKFKIVNCLGDIFPFERKN